MNVVIMLKGNRDNTKLTQTISEQLKQFSIATGVNCFCVSKDGEGYKPAVNCKLCKTVSGVTGNTVECHKALMYGAYQAERFDGRYIFYCPMGLVNFASPIFADGRIFAVAIGGPVLLIEKDEYISEDIIDKLNIDSIYTNQLKEDLNCVPQLSPEKVTALSQMLFAVCSYISGAEQLQYLNDEEAIGNDMAKYINFINTMGSDLDFRTYPIEKERELLSLISVGDKEHSQALLDDILHHIITYSNKDFEKAKARILELVVLLSRAALEGGADLEQIFGLNYKFLQQINTYKTVEELSNWLSNIMVRFTDCVFTITNVKHIDTIYKAVDYIKRNYSKKLTLEEVAGFVYLSPSYFSKIFKEELDISFNNYLNQIRIENSKRFLMNDELDMIQISEMIGFEDQSYFSKVFKKIAGVTPGKYRQRHRK
jgi:AraC-type DNA-binding domain-containing proteins